MQGGDQQDGALFSYVSLEARVPSDHPLRAIRAVVDEALAELSPAFERLYSNWAGRLSRRSGCCGRCCYRRFCGPSGCRGLMSDDHFSVDGTLIDAWPSMKSFRPKGGDDDDDPPPGRNAERNFRRQKRSNETHASTTDPDARLYRKGNGQSSRLCFMAIC